MRHHSKKKEKKRKKRKKKKKKKKKEKKRKKNTSKDKGETKKKQMAEAAAPHQEQQYLDLLRELITTGDERVDRTGVGTFGKFGKQLRFDLRTEFPLLTTKKVFWRGVVEELRWFISGSTNAKILQDKQIRIWDGNSSREFLDRLGLTDREEGDLGPVYGFQWRHFGAKYTNTHADYTGMGVDQLAKIIHTIKTNPTDRRIILSAWNPADLHLMALPPCHMFAQFYVNRGELSCQVYLRSCDMGLGAPFNIASYALLTVMMAHVTKLAPGDVTFVMGDCHVYKTHVEALKGQIERSPNALPKLRIVREVTSIDEFTFDDFELTGYEPHPPIKMEMAV